MDLKLNSENAPYIAVTELLEDGDAAVISFVDTSYPNIVEKCYEWVHLMKTWLENESPEKKFSIVVLDHVQSRVPGDLEDVSAVIAQALDAGYTR